MRSAVAPDVPTAGLPGEDGALWLRHRAALDVIRSGRETDGELLLSFVVWPTPLLADLSERVQRADSR